MTIYDLNKIEFIEYDIENIFNIIESLYKVDFTIDGATFYPKTFVSKEEHWTSESSKRAFNKIVPIAKGLIKDMYASLESVFKGLTGNFVKLDLEEKYKYLKEFRLLNNKVKHFNDSEAEINLTELVLIESTGNYIDIYCNFKYKDKFEALRLCDFIEIYITILEDYKIISITRST